MDGRGQWADFTIIHPMLRRSRGKVKYWSMDNIKIKVDGSTKKLRGLWMKDTHKRAHWKWDVLTHTEVFANQKMVPSLQYVHIYSLTSDW
jgi:hypothetical protein